MASFPGSWHLTTLALLTADALVGRVAHAGALDAVPMIGAGGVDALVLLNVTLGSLPTRVAQAVALLVLPITAAQHRAGVCNDMVHLGSQVVPRSPP